MRLKERFKESCAGSRDGNKKGGGKGAGARKKKNPVLVKSTDTSQIQGKAFLPDCKGCSISLECVWHGRWKVACPCDEPPRVFSATFTKGGQNWTTLL